jgi:hypothetical protein
MVVLPSKHLRLVYHILKIHYMKPLFFNKQNGLVVFLFMCITTLSFAQGNVGVGTNTPDASAILEILSTNQGLLVPRMNTAGMNAIPSPANSLLIYNTDSMCYFFYRQPSTAWISLCSINSNGGNSGFTGTTGITGGTGLTGYTGATGTNGSVGATGSTGGAGAVGVTGSTGIAGVVGVTGSTGDAGLIGITGSTGDAGLLGVTGSTGVQGFVGITGSTGDPGPVGCASPNYIIKSNGTSATCTVAPIYENSIGHVGIHVATLPTHRLHIGENGALAQVKIQSDGHDNAYAGGEIIIANSTVLGSIPSGSNAAGTIQYINDGFATNFMKMGVGFMDTAIYIRATGPGASRKGRVGIATSIPASTVSIASSNTLNAVDANLSVGTTFATIAAPNNGAIIEGTVGVGNSAPSASAMLDVLSTNKGILVPRMNTTSMNAIASPANSLLIYNTDSMCYFFYRQPSTSWISLCSVNSGGGSIGSTGTTGSTGIIGVTGTTGRTGNTGTTGNTGSVGVTGTVGTTGTTGNVGVTGTTGRTGNTGNTGSIGVTGSTGTQGNVGSTGSTGPVGCASANYLMKSNGTTATCTVAPVYENSSGQLGINMGTLPTTRVHIGELGSLAQLRLQSDGHDNAYAGGQIFLSNSTTLGNIHSVPNAEGSITYINDGFATNHMRFGLGFMDTAIYIRATGPGLTRKGRIGIATSTPASTLSIASSNSSNSVDANLSVGKTYALIAAPNNGAIVEGTVGIGISLPTTRVHIGELGALAQLRLQSDGHDNAYAGGQIFLSNSTNLGNINTPPNAEGSITYINDGFATNHMRLGLGFMDTALYIRATGPGLTRIGRIGIATSTPASTLSIASSNTGNAVDANLSVGTTYALISAPNNGAIIEGRVGIGTSAPAQLLHVNNGFVRFEGSTSGRYFEFQPGTVQRLVTTNDLFVEPAGGWVLRSGAGNNLGQIRDAASNTFVNFDGATQRVGIGIGTSTPSEKLEICGNLKVVGTINASSTITASTGVTCSSDKRFKTDIRPLTHSLSKVLDIQGVNYKWKVNEFPEKQFSETNQIGFIAQEIELIYPELVFTDKDGYKSVDYSRLSPILVEAIKELNAKNEAQQLLIQGLEDSNKKWESTTTSLLKENQLLKSDIQKIKEHLNLESEAKR